MNKENIMKLKPEGVSEEEFTEALKQILLSKETPSRSENREPTQEELARRFKLVRKPA